jgi:hypothetical protein
MLFEKAPHKLVSKARNARKESNRQFVGRLASMSGGKITFVVSEKHLFTWHGRSKYHLAVLADR